MYVMLILMSCIVFEFMMGQITTSHHRDSDCTASNVSIRIVVICANVWFIFVCHFVPFVIFSVVLCDQTFYCVII